MKLNVLSKTFLIGTIFTAMIQNNSYQYTTKYVELITGETVYYIDEGLGEQTIFFVHGLANNSLSWQQNIASLRKKFRCIAIDLPGNGLSTAAHENYCLKYFSRVVVEVIEKLRLKNVVLCGHSMGGQIVLTTALLYPHKFDKLILCAAAGLEYFSGFEIAVYKSGINFLDFFSTEENSLTKLIRSSFYHNTHQADAMIDDLIELMHRQPVDQYRKMVEACIDAMLNEPVYEQLVALKQSVLVIFGERDVLIPNRFLHPITTRQFAETAIKRIPKHQLILMPNAGHFIHWEKANEVNELIQEWIMP